MHDTDFFAPCHGQFKSRARNALTGVTRDFAHGHGEIRHRHDFARAGKHGAVGIKAFRVFTYNNEIKGMTARRGNGGACARGPDVGVKVEPFAQFTRGIETTFRHRRIVIVRDRAQHNAMHGFGLLQHARRKCCAAGFQSRKADVGVRKRQAEFEQIIRGVQDIARGRCDFRTNAVTSKHQKLRRHHAHVAPSVDQPASQSSC